VTCKRISAVLVLGLAVLLLGGCQGDGIERYQVPREEKVRPGPIAQNRGAIRFLGAIIPHEKTTWVFKLMGPAALVGKYQEEFDRFIRSIRFNQQDDPPITWKVPEGWEESRKAGAGNAMVRRYTTFYLNLKGHPLELTVFDFPKGAGSVLDNVNRWRKQIGLKDVGEEELAKITREIKVDDMPVTMVDMATEGAAQEKPAEGKADVRMLVAVIDQEKRNWFFKLTGPAAVIDKNKAAFDRFIQSIRFADKAGQEISWKLPEGWREERGGGLRYATIHLGPRDHPLELTVFAFGPRAGSLLANINRWRGQIGLEDITEADLDKVSRQIKVKGVPVTLIDLSTAGAGREEQ
jgi:hypothetical protein